MCCVIPVAKVKGLPFKSDQLFFTILVDEDPPSPVPFSLLVETLLSLTRWHRDDAIPTRPLSVRCLPNNQHRAKGSPMAYIVITYSERTHATSPHS